MKNNIKNNNQILNTLFFPSIIIGGLYIIWRTFCTIDFSSSILNITAGLLLLFAEIYSFAMFTGFSYIVKKARDYKLVLPLGNKNYKPSVDVFICTYNEGLDILIDTFDGCKNLTYKNKQVYVLDDGNRPHIKQVALDYGFNYISRETNEGYKAGNINNAIKHTSGELIAVFDADHIPVSNFVEEIVEYFNDEKVSVVQTPQHFHNSDPVQKNLKAYNYLQNEQDLFFRVLQPGMSCSNSTLVAGTNFIIKREILEELGGFPQTSITEDTALGIMLEARGYKVIFYDKPLAIGLSAETYADYIRQRVRWAKGTVQIFLDKTLRAELNKMPLKQKQPYFMGLLYYMLSIPRLITLILPASYLLFQIKPVVTDAWLVLLTAQFAYFGIKTYYFYSAASKHRNIFFTDLYEVCTWFPLLFELSKMMFLPNRLKTEKFEVTNKGALSSKNVFNINLLLPNFILLLFCVFAYFKSSLGYSSFLYKPAFFVNSFWNLCNIFMLVMALMVGVETNEKRTQIRVPVDITTHLKLNNNDMSVQVINLSKGGALLASSEFMENTSDMYIDLPQLSNLSIERIESSEQGAKIYSRMRFKQNNNLVKSKIFSLMMKNSDNWE